MRSLETDVFELWHRRLGHPADRISKLVPTIKTSVGSKSLQTACETYPQAKQSRSNYPSSISRASSIFELVYCDLWGPYATPSSCGAHYFHTLVDDYSRDVWIYLLKSKTEVFATFTSFLSMISSQFGVAMKIVCSDNNTEFYCMRDVFDERGIIFQPLVSIHLNIMGGLRENINKC